MTATAVPQLSGQKDVELALRSARLAPEPLRAAAESFDGIPDGAMGIAPAHTGYVDVVSVAAE